MKRFLSSVLLQRNKKSRLFNRILIVLNLLIFGLFALEALYPGHPLIRILELLFGTAFLVEYLARLWVAPRRLVFIFNIFSIIDILVLLSLFAPFLVGNLALLRILRSLKILRTYYILRLVRKESSTIARYWGTAISILNFVVFLGVMTAIVFVAEAQHNPHINNYIDALYFTVSTLTTTGYGDVTASGTTGKVLSVVAMLIGITLFLRLTRTIFRGATVYYTCPDCGLSAHDLDATHCKHCGRPVNHKHEPHSPY